MTLHHFVNIIRYIFLNSCLIVLKSWVKKNKKCVNDEILRNLFVLNNFIILKI